MEKLTTCEELVMKTVWDAGEELSLMEIMQRVNDKYHKEWKAADSIYISGASREKGVFKTLPPRTCILLSDIGSA